MNMHIKKIGVVGASVITVVLSGAPVLAINSHASAQAAASQTAAQTRLSEVKLKVCQQREKSIDNIMARIADRGQKQLNLFSSIATKVETFYTNKGKTLSNYDTLVADVNAKQAAAQTAVNTVKADKADFKCDGTDPHGAAATFQADLKLEISALKDFRTAVKNLIVGVKSVEGTTQSSSNSSTGGNQ